VTGRLAAAGASAVGSAALACALVVAPAGAFEEPLTWAPPKLDANPIVHRVTPWGYSEESPPNRDCLVQMPDQPVTDRVGIYGCRNIVVIGGEFDLRSDGLSDPGNDPALDVANFSGTAHIEGVKFGGAGLGKAVRFWTDKPGTIVQLENNYVADLHAPSEFALPLYADGWPREHPSIFQTWEGPDLEIRADKNTGYTPYEGFNVDSGAYGAQFKADRIRIKRTNIRLDSPHGMNGRQCFEAYETADRGLPAGTDLYRAMCKRGTQTFISMTYPQMNSVLYRATWWNRPTRGRPVAEGLPLVNEVDPSHVGIGYDTPGYAPGKPTGLSAKPGCYSLSADWNDVGNAEAYQVRSLRYPDGAFSATTVVFGTENSQEIHLWRPAGGYYAIQVRALNPQGASDWVTTSAGPVQGGC
jgi:hypothetical protein